jgi:hypothetical protein
MPPGVRAHGLREASYVHETMLADMVLQHRLKMILKQQQGSSDWPPFWQRIAMISGGSNNRESSPNVISTCGEYGRLVLMCSSPWAIWRRQAGRISRTRCRRWLASADMKRGPGRSASGQCEFDKRVNSRRCLNLRRIRFGGTNPPSFRIFRRIWQNEPTGFNSMVEAAGFIHCFWCNSLNQNVFG